MKKKTLSVVAFLGAAIIAGGLVANCSKQPKQQPAPVAKKEQPAVPIALPAPPARLNVDFNQATLADVVPFVTEHTGKGFVLNGTEGKTISWTEFGISRGDLFESFLSALSGYDLVARPLADPNTFTIEAKEQPPVRVQLDFATCARGTFLLLGEKIFSIEQFPYPTYQHGGHWYAMIPPSALSSGSSKNAQD